MLSLTGEWLRGRKQRVMLNEVKLGWKQINSRVPQGSVMGPLLFFVVINDFDVGVGCRIS